MVLSKRRGKAGLEKSIGYKFRRLKLLEAALTHRSYRFENQDVEEDNQRLEFLGDAVLGFLAAAYMYRYFQDCDEGIMTSFRSQITSGKALTSIAREIDLGDFLLVGKGEERSGGRKRASTLADALEAVMGAAYMDGGIRAAEKVFKSVFLPSMESLSGDVWEGNPKGKLQEYSQRKWKRSPKYSVIRKEGPAHAIVFTVEVTLGDDRIRVTGKGRNKQMAESEAATKALKQLNL